MKPLSQLTHRFVKGLGIMQPLDTKQQSTELLLGGLLLMLALGGLAI